MNREDHTMPVFPTTVADLLLELPLPTPLTPAGSCNLISHLTITERAQQLLCIQDSSLISPLIDAIFHTTIDHIEIAEEYCNQESHIMQTSQLAQNLFEKNPDLFGDSAHHRQNDCGDDDIHSGISVGWQCCNVSVPSEECKLSTLSDSGSSPDQDSRHSHLQHSSATQVEQILGSQTPEEPFKSLVCDSWAPAILPSDQKQSASFTHDNTISEEMNDSLTSSSQKSPIMFNSAPSSQCNVQVPQTLRSDDSIVNEIDFRLENSNQNDGKGNHILNSAQNVVSNIESNTSCLAALLNDPAYLLEPIPSSLYSSVSRTECINPHDIDMEQFDCHIPCKQNIERIQPAPHSTSYQGEGNAKEISMHDFTQELNSQLLSHTNELEYKDKNESAVMRLKKEICPSELVVVLSKFSLEDQLLAEKSVNQFLIKTKSVKSTPQEVQHCVQNKTVASTSYDESNKSITEKSPVDLAGTSPRKSKKLKNRKSKKVVNSESLSVTLMESNTYQYFSRVVDSILDSIEYADFSVSIDEETDISPEVLLPVAQLLKLTNGAAKLKRLHAMNLFPPERLVLLLAILERNVVDGAKLLPIQIMEEQEDEAGSLYEATMERVLRSADASLAALYIITSPKMPQKVFLEDVIEKIIIFLKYQLQNTIFPVFDPAYRLNSKSDDDCEVNTKRKRSQTHKIKKQSILPLYNKLHETLSLLADLLELQTLPDIIISRVSTLGIGPFFVEGIHKLQLNALRIVTNIFARYDKHRELILEDILASIERLPTSKCNLRNYRLNTGEDIQMLTALVLQLIHSSVSLSNIHQRSKCSSNEDISEKNKITESTLTDEGSIIIASYETSIKTTINFLTVFLNKSVMKGKGMDYRPLFHNFVEDLLAVVNSPEWPAAGLLLSVLGRLLLNNFSNKSMEMILRITSLEYLGVLASWLRKEAVTNQDKRRDIVNDIVQRIISDNDSDPSLSNNEGRSEQIVNRDKIQILQKKLLQYFDSKIESDPSLQFSRGFYIAQWYTDAAKEIQLWEQDPHSSTKETVKSIVLNDGKLSLLKINKRSPQVKDIEEDAETECECAETLHTNEANAAAAELAKGRKRFLLSVINWRKPSNISNDVNDHIDYKTAKVVSFYLLASRKFSSTFNLYLSHILQALNETVVPVRSKAMKCLALVVAADPNILSRVDIQRGVHGRLHDQSISVREATVELLGKYILMRPTLLNQYYGILTTRILDTGVSVRKRVIKILKDICVEHPDFPKIPDICVQIIRRVDDEDGVRNLVAEVFQSMWFTPISEKEQGRALQKAKTIASVVDASRDMGLESFEQLLMNLLKDNKDRNNKSIVKACKQIVDCLVENLINLEDSSQNTDCVSSSPLVGCLATLYLFSKIYPPFLVPHATTIQPYLSMKCNTSSDFLVVKYVAQTLALVVPLIEHPSESFLVQIEEDVVKLILRQHIGLLSSCVSCLAAVVNKVTHNYQLIVDCFQKIFFYLLVYKEKFEKNPEDIIQITPRAKLLRSLYTVGLFYRYFDFDIFSRGSEQNNEISLKDKVFQSIIYFSQHGDEDIRLKALTGLGFMMIRCCEIMLSAEVKSLYISHLSSVDASPAFKCQVLKNIAEYLTEEEMQMIHKEAEWSKNAKSENLKDIPEDTSGMASTVIQVYLKQILECIMHTLTSVRKACLSVIQLILRQGLVHPAQIIPYLICLGSDDDSVIRTKAEQLLQDIERRYPSFIQMKATLGIRMSYKMQQLIQNPNEILRGYRCLDSPVSRNGFLYTLTRSTRQSRRALVLSLLKLFDEEAHTPLTELMYIADNIAYFPYLSQDEPLFIMHELDIMISVSGSNLLQAFEEGLLNNQSRLDGITAAENDSDDEEEDDNISTILKRLPKDTSDLRECIIASQSCTLLLYIKQTLKEMYSITDNKIQLYSPIETTKVYGRHLNRKENVRFNPEAVLNVLKTKEFEGELDEQGRENLVSQYLHFKQLMLTVDPSSDDEIDGDSTRPKQSKHTVSSILLSPVTNASEETPTKSSDKTESPVRKRQAKHVASRKRRSSSDIWTPRCLKKKERKCSK